MKSKLNSDKNIGTVGQILFLGDDGNLCWRNETEEEQNEIVCVIEEKDIGTFKIEDNKINIITFKYPDGNIHSHHHFKKIMNRKLNES